MGARMARQASKKRGHELPRRRILAQMMAHQTGGLIHIHIILSPCPKMAAGQFRRCRFTDESRPLAPIKNINMTVYLLEARFCSGSFVLGLLLGGISGYYGGWIDTIIQRFIEIIRSFPELPL